MTGDAIGFYLIAFPAFVLALVALTVTLRWAERRWPRFSRWLDEHVGDEPTWMTPW